jgi:Uma2 family endonuclease
VQPDIVFLRAGNTPGTEDQGFQGIPDLVIEVLSPGTRRRDRTLKRDAYRDAGVPEYWLVDPDARTVEVHVLESGKYVEHFRGGAGEAVSSSVLPGFTVNVAGLFLP